jgi:hypothetical protein
MSKKAFLCLTVDAFDPCILGKLIIMGKIVAVGLPNVFVDGHRIQPDQAAFGIGTQFETPKAWTAEKPIFQSLIMQLAT